MIPHGLAGKIVKKLHAPGTNQFAGFGKFRPLANWKKIIAFIFCFIECKSFTCIFSVPSIFHSAFICEAKSVRLIIFVDNKLDTMISRLSDFSLGIILPSTVGIVCGRGSFAVHFGDYFAVWGFCGQKSFALRQYLRTCSILPGSCWFSLNVTKSPKIQTTKLSILLRLYFLESLEHLKLVFIQNFIPKGFLVLW